MSDTLKRHWQILRLLPRLPKMISTPDIHRALLEAGFQIDIRNVQEDMKALQKSWSQLETEASGRTKLWAWSRDALPMDTPRMTPQRSANIFDDRGALARGDACQHDVANETVFRFG